MQMRVRHRECTLSFPPQCRRRRRCRLVETPTEARLAARSGPTCSAHARARSARVSGSVPGSRGRDRGGGERRAVTRAGAAGQPWGPTPAQHSTRRRHHGGRQAVGQHTQHTRAQEQRTESVWPTRLCGPVQAGESAKANCLERQKARYECQ